MFLKPATNVFSRYKLLKQAVASIMNTPFGTSNNLFETGILPGLLEVYDLMLFDNIKNPDFQHYLAYFQHDLRLDIEICKSITPQIPEIKRRYLLQGIRQRMPTRLKAVEMAFNTYAPDKRDLLYGNLAKPPGIPALVFSILKNTEWAH